MAPSPGEAGPCGSRAGGWGEKALTQLWTLLLSTWRDVEERTRGAKSWVRGVLHALGPRGSCPAPTLYPRLYLSASKPGEGLTTAPLTPTPRREKRGRATSNLTTDLEIARFALGYPYCPRTVLGAEPGSGTLPRGAVRALGASWAPRGGHWRNPGHRSPGLRRPGQM